MALEESADQLRRGTHEVLIESKRDVSLQDGGVGETLACCCTWRQNIISGFEKAKCLRTRGEIVEYMKLRCRPSPTASSQ